MGKQKTNMASEFWFFSQLHRLGYDATITLGNTKRVDIYVKLLSDKMLSFDVKKKESFERRDCRLGRPELQKDNHFFAFIDLKIRKESNNRIEFDGDPECFIIEGKKLEEVALWAKPIIGISQDLKNDPDASLWLWPEFLGYLKKGTSLHQKKITTQLEKFKQYRALEGEIDYKKYKQIIMTRQDFENVFYKLKRK